ncbi:MAG: cobalamin-binding protein [Ignavibacteria bacterium]|nr:cobalamin-binding protein [Ignavibacteria bacterium]
MLKSSRLALIIILVVVSISCQKTHEIDKNATSIKDDLGNEISLDTLPKRIISLAPNITETLYAIDSDSLIVGVTNYCDYPADAKNKKKVGGMIDPNYEIITSLKPDLILLTVEGNAKQSYVALKNLGLKVFVTNPRDVNGIIKMINDLGIITGKEKEANEISNKIYKDKIYFEELNRSSVDKKCLLLISVNPLMTANHNTFINEIVELSGFDNLYRNEAIEYPMISYEDVTEKDPEYIIFPTDTSDVKGYKKYKEEISDNLNSTKAVKENRVIFVDENILFRPGPRIINAVKLIRSKIE